MDEGRKFAVVGSNIPLHGTNTH